MKRFLAIYLGSQDSAAFKKWNAMGEAERKERQRSGMEAWMRWGKAHETSIVDAGTPLGKTKRVDANGATDTKNMMTGYVVIEAESHEARGAPVRKSSAFFDLPGRVGGNHGMPAHAQDVSVCNME